MGQTFYLDKANGIHVDLAGGDAGYLGKRLSEKLGASSPFDQILGPEQIMANVCTSVWDWEPLGLGELVPLRAALHEVVRELGGDVVPWGTRRAKQDRTLQTGELLGAVDERIARLQAQPTS